MGKTVLDPSTEIGPGSPEACPPPLAEPLLELPSLPPPQAARPTTNIETKAPAKILERTVFLNPFAPFTKRPES
jgi:hypothetical protein